MFTKEYTTTILNTVLGVGYRTIAKPLFFRQDPEEVHDRVIALGKRLGKHVVTKSLIRAALTYTHPMLPQTIRGMSFPNPIGLAAGFDKNAQLTDILPSVGFGFGEVGSITGEPCKGNAQPRLWRLPKTRSLLVYYGLVNVGCEEVAQRLNNKKFQIPIGVSIAKTNCRETANREKGIQDYIKSYNIFRNIGDYYTINISCPNAYGGQPFTDSESLDLLLRAVNSQPRTKPIFLKLSPDLSRQEIDGIIRLSRKYNIDGLICSNLAKDRSHLSIKDNQEYPDHGGFSGKIMEHRANELLKYMYQQTHGEFVLIGCGGVFSAQDAYKKIRLGASLIQLITGMIYQGPQIVSEINQGLVRMLRRDGFKSLQDAIGIDN